MATWESIIEKANLSGANSNYGGATFKTMMLDFIEKCQSLDLTPEQVSENLISYWLEVGFPFQVLPEGSEGDTLALLSGIWTSVPFPQGLPTGADGNVLIHSSGAWIASSQIVDTYAIDSVDIANRNLSRATSGQPSVSWDSSVLIDASNVNSLDWTNRALKDAGGNTSWDWEGRAGYDVGAALSFDYSGRNLINTTGYYTLNWDTGITVDGITNTSSINWNTRELLKSDGTTAFNWESGKIGGGDWIAATSSNNGAVVSSAVSQSHFTEVNGIVTCTVLGTVDLDFSVVPQGFFVIDYPVALLFGGTFRPIGTGQIHGTAGKLCSIVMNGTEKVYFESDNTSFVTTASFTLTFQYKP